MLNLVPAMLSLALVARRHRTDSTLSTECRRVNTALPADLFPLLLNEMLGTLAGGDGLVAEDKYGGGGAVVVVNVFETSAGRLEIDVSVLI
jgi:hypothetical protein